jgi:hypothetical protein
MSAWKSVKTAISTIAPVIGTALGGPFGGVAASTLSKVLLGKENATEDEIMEAISVKSHESYAKIKEAEINFQSKIAELSVIDRKNARERELAFVERGQRDKVQSFVAISIIVGFFLFTICTMFFPLKNGSLDIIFFLIGYVGNSLVTLVQYYFGSSKGSALKTDIINEKHGLLDSIMSKLKK